MPACRRSTRSTPRFVVGRALRLGSPPPADAIAGLARRMRNRGHPRSRARARDPRRGARRRPPLPARPEGHALLRAVGITPPESRIAATLDEAVSAAEAIGYPVVLKVVSREIVHKSDAGGVALDLENRAEVIDAYEAIRHGARRVPDARITGVEVAEMVRHGTELIVGARRDASFGPIVMFGLGGIYVEVLADVAFRGDPAPAPGGAGDDQGDPRASPAAGHPRRGAARHRRGGRCAPGGSPRSSRAATRSPTSRSTRWRSSRKGAARRDRRPGGARLRRGRSPADVRTACRKRPARALRGDARADRSPCRRAAR